MPRLQERRGLVKQSDIRKDGTYPPKSSKPIPKGWMRCRTCNGVGNVPHNYSTRMCPMCEGTGALPM